MPSTSQEAAARARRAREAFTWGREVDRELVFRVHDPPPLVRPLFELEVTEYLETKGVRGRPTIYTHRHRSPFALVTGEPERTGELVSSKTCPRYKRPLFILGELVRLAGKGPDGPRELKFDRGRFFLAGDPRTRDLFVLPTTTRARHVWIARKTSTYTITARGIEG